METLDAAIALREEGLLPLKKVQELGALLRRMPAADGAYRDDVEWGHVLMREVHRVLGRVAMGAGGEGITPARAGLVFEEGLSLVEVHARVESWAERVWLAELFSRAKPRARGDTGGAR
ncbi:hypothetical protein ACLESD_04410 [Pyxidicoccus sp. 3LFB2]